MNENIIGYCTYCKEPVYCYEKFMINNSKVYHNDEANNCLNQSQLYVDDFGDFVFDEE